MFTLIYNTVIVKITCIDPTGRLPHRTLLLNRPLAHAGNRNLAFVGGAQELREVGYQPKNFTTSGERDGQFIRHPTLLRHYQLKQRFLAALLRNEPSKSTGTNRAVMNLWRITIRQVASNS